MEITISIIGALVAISVSIVGAVLSYRNSISLHTRKLKESHYIHYIQQLHNLCAYNSDVEVVRKYVEARDVLFAVASAKVVRSIIEFEEFAAGKHSDFHDEYITKTIKAIREDLNVSNKGLPLLYFKKA